MELNIQGENCSTPNIMIKLIKYTQTNIARKLKPLALPL